MTSTEKKARGWDHLSIEVLVVDVGLQGQPVEASFSDKPPGQDEKEARAGTAAPTMESEVWRDHFGSVHRGPVRRQRMTRRRPRMTGGQENRRWGGGETRGD